MNVAQLRLEKLDFKLSNLIWEKYPYETKCNKEMILLFQM